MVRTVGVTGGTGSGKSTICRESQLPCIDADKLAHEVYAPGSPLNARIAECFGSNIVNSDGTINRAMLGSLVFSDAAKLAALENMVWPSVKDLARERIAEIARDGSPTVVLLEAAVLLKAGWEDLVDAIVVLDCGDEDEVLRRVMDRDRGQRAEEVLRRKISESKVQSEHMERVKKPWKMVDTNCSVETAVDRFKAALRQLFGDFCIN